MKGQILHIDDRTGDGVITSDDGQRYAFTAVELKGAGQLALPGAAVDFEAAGNSAVEIYPDPGPPHLAARVGEKNKLVAGLLAIFVGTFGVHKFYLGANRAGLVMLACTLLGWMLFFIPNAIVGLISLIEGVIYMTRSDTQFYETYEIEQKAWF